MTILPSTQLKNYNCATLYTLSLSPRTPILSLILRSAFSLSLSLSLSLSPRPAKPRRQLRLLPESGCLPRRRHQLSLTAVEHVCSRRQTIPILNSTAQLPSSSTSTTRPPTPINTSTAQPTRRKPI
ncbi:hypothetical protein RchiOBHm_Chr2g0163881 [Rosa chinensis]|uniref:Uncharacterized protein n=1 Tax=Rosa chinensis TaxID=74649 RepID=A0A2P6S3F5_ROSCH|nr:hypothetical protein RchiOBHm_Chr2g0163881 [Rosa chinensis]